MAARRKATARRATSLSGKLTTAAQKKALTAKARPGRRSLPSNTGVVGSVRRRRITKGRGTGGRKGTVNPAGIVRGSGGVRRPKSGIRRTGAAGVFRGSRSGPVRRAPSGRRVTGQRPTRTGGSLQRRAAAGRLTTLGPASLRNRGRLARRRA
jgi:hypothetical protein